MITRQNADMLWELIEPIKVGMLVTASDKKIHAYPMHIVQTEFDGILYFFTDKNSQKVKELEKNSDVCIAFSCPKQQTYVSITGTAQITHDTQLIEKFWNPFVAAWFPQGKSDPSVGLIAINVFEAETWDATSNKMVQLFQYIKAAITGEKPAMGEHNKI